MITAVISQYYLLSKPGIVYGNTLAALAGYFLAAGKLSLTGLLMMTAGIMSVLASAGYANNIMDIRIDRIMKRTKSRPLAQGTLPVWSAYLGASLLLVLGLILLAASGLTGRLSALLAFAGWTGYVFVYGYAKRTTYHSTLIGALPGALPPLVGYSYGGGGIDMTAVILFLMMVCWQMPHFYAISLFRSSDYAAAGLPVLPNVKGHIRVIREVKLYSVLYLILSMLMIAAAPLNVLSALLLVAGAMWWNATAFRRVPADGEIMWARKMFKLSLLVLLIWPVVFLLKAL